MARPQRANVTLILGPPGSGKTSRALEAYRRCVDEHGHDAALYLVPTQRVADIVRGRLMAAGLSGLFDFRVMTFTDAANALLVANHAPVSAISDVQRVTLLRTVLARMRREELGPLAYHTHRPGLAASLAEDIDEFKAAGIEAEELLRALRAMPTASAQEIAVARVYRRYQELLHRLGLYDRPGTLWAALEELEAGHLRPLDRLRLVVADGFSDFTTIEARTLAHLVAAAGEGIITLTLEQEGDRPELQAIPRRTLAELDRHLGPVAELERVVLRGEDECRSDREYVVRELFNPAAPGREGGDGSLVIMHAPGHWAEVRMVAREIKRILTAADGEGQGVSPAQIAIIARTLEPYDEALRQVFDEYGLPLFVSRGERLSRCPVARIITRLLELVVYDFPRTATLEVWRSTYVDLESLAGEEYATASEADDISRRAGTVGGQQAWVRSIERLEERVRRRLEAVRSRQVDEEWYEPAETLERVLEAAPKVRATFSALAERLKALQRRASRAEHAAGLLQLLDELGVGERIVLPEVHTARNLTAWNAIVQGLQAIADVDRVAGGEEVPLEQFAVELSEMMRVGRLQTRGRGEGRVVALDVHDALQTSFDYVFIIGLTEGVFPAVRPPDPLLADERRRELAERGLPLRERRAGQDEEAYLFHLALGTARKRVYLSYPDTDAAGDPLVRSYYVDEVERLVPSAPVRVLRLRDVVPPLGQAASGREMAERALWLEYRGRGAADAEHRAGALQALSRHERWRTPSEQARLGARVELVRDGRLAGLEGAAGIARLGPFDAVITSAEAREALEERFGPGHIFSANQLSLYGACPMAFFFERVLRLEPLEEPGEDVTRLQLGRLVHSALREFYQRRIAAGHGHLAEDKEDEQRLEEAWRLMQEVLAERCDQFEASDLTGHELLWDIARGIVEARLWTWMLAEVTIPEKLGLKGVPRPAHFELAYAPETGMGLRLELPQAGGVEFRGRIDRIDELGTDGFVVYDYKLSGGASLAEMLDGVDFQLVLYALAAERCVYGGGRECHGWAYVRVGSVQGKDLLKGATAEPERVREVIEAALEHIDQHVTAMRAGEFSWPERCTRRRYCEYQTICRYEPRRVRRRMGEGRL